MFTGHTGRMRWLLLGLISSNVLHAADWPQWLGPQRDAVWREDGILEKDLVDEAELEYLDHRSSLNESVIDINEKLAKINKQYADILQKMLLLNDELIEQCSSRLEQNSRLAQDSRVADDPTID